MNKFLKRLAGFSFGPILGAMLSMIQAPILARLMVEGAYGQSGVFREMLLQVPNFIYLGLDQAYTREYHRFANKKQLLQQAVMLPLIVGLLLCAVMIAFAEPISLWLFKDAHYPHIVWLSSVWLFATIMERFLLLTIRMEEKAMEFSNYTLLLKINVFILSLVLVFAGVRDFQSAVYGLLIGQLLGDAVLFHHYRHFFDWRQFKVDWSLIHQMVLFGLPVMLAVSLTSVLTTMSSVFMNQYHSGHDLDVYTATATIVSVLGILKTSFASFWVPTAYRWYDENKSMKHYQFISDALLFVLTVFFFGLLLGKGAIVWLLGERYSQTPYIIGLLSFPHIMYTLSETTTLGIVFSRKTYFNIIISVLALIPSFALNMWLTPQYSYKGAAAASCAAYITFYLARTYFSKRSGFYFSQKKAVGSILLMTVAAGVNAFEVPYVVLWTLLIGLICLGVQFSTIRTGLSIRQNSAEWNFS